MYTDPVKLPFCILRLEGRFFPIQKDLDNDSKHYKAAIVANKDLVLYFWYARIILVATDEGGSAILKIMTSTDSPSTLPIDAKLHSPRDTYFQNSAPLLSEM